MNTFNDNGSGEQVKQGKYANAFLLFLMSALVAVASYFAYQNNQMEANYSKMAERDRAHNSERQSREDSIRREYQATLDKRENYHEGRYNKLQYKIDSIRDNTIADLKMGRVKSEALATQSKNIVKTLQSEVKKTSEVTKELDSVSNTVTQSLSQ